VLSDNQVYTPSRSCAGRGVFAPSGGVLCDTIKTHAEAHGESVNGFINRAIAETMERDNAAAEGRTEAKEEVGE